MQAEEEAERSWQRGAEEVGLGNLWVGCGDVNMIERGIPSRQPQSSEHLSRSEKTSTATTTRGVSVLLRTCILSVCELMSALRGGTSDITISTTTTLVTRI